MGCILPGIFWNETNGDELRKHDFIGSEWVKNYVLGDKDNCFEGATVWQEIE